ncbi:nucleoside-diphosphatase [Ephemerocybe angulata]|uniref:Nucleoside-diphosphatase n=1 Tax=Ephemerocybe angulata TaxID=980116 RepID=A0A8H6MGJ4_9AGAR|nr:nucleoside-diphosphatase [Tulosesus angulatus]
MAPPTANDPWLAGRHFGIVVDAGSSGSRLQIYSWKDPRSMKVLKGSELAYRLPKVEKGTKDEKKWVKKVEPGLSPLLQHALDHIPPSLHKETPLFLLATAGMRLLAPKKQAEILQETCRFFTTHSNFKIDGPGAAGPCGSSVRIITGEEEGLFGWIAVNYLMDGFTGSLDQRTTYGFLDMGGASTQIAFEPSVEHRGNTKDLVDVRLRLLGGEEIHHKVFVTTWLGYGTNQARERYVGKAIAEFEATRHDDDEDMEEEADVVSDPCLPKDLELVETPVHSQPATSHMQSKHTLIGTGSFEKCLDKTASLLNKNTPCPDTPCLMNGVHVPPIDFSASHFIGVSEYWYSSEHIFGLGGAYDFVQYERAASEFCSRNWDDILHEHEASRAQHHLGGDGEVEEGGKIVDTGRWGPKVEIPRLQMQCFKAAWIANVLHEGLGMPRIVDPGGNSTTDGDTVEAEAGKKGLGRPTFQSMDTVGDIAISWTLGKMVLEASKEVPPLYKSSKPIVDPIDDIEDLNHSHIHPIRPPFLSLGGLEDRLTPHLPSSLSRTNLGFSPVLLFLILWVFFTSLILFMCYPLRRQIRSFFLRCVRTASSRRDPFDDLLEEGRIGGGSRPASPTLFGSKMPSPLRHYFNHDRTKSHASPLSVLTNNSTLRNFMPSTSARPSPTRAYSMTNGSSSPAASTTQYIHASSISRSPSPAVGMMDENNNHIPSNDQPVFNSRSRNASQMNLSSLTPRPIAMSKSTSFSGKNL